MNTLNILQDSLLFRALGVNGPGLLEHTTHIPVASGIIHIWSARYSDLGRYYPILSSFLCAEEVIRAAEFKKQKDAQNYILRHGLVRAVLGQYIQEEPGKVLFVHGMCGKPDLDPESNDQDIRFSLSSTGEMVCLGVTRRSGIGLDIVKTTTHCRISEIGQYLFTPGEREWIARTNPDRRSNRFFRIWSLKEALLKATGNGVKMMQEVDVSGIMSEAYLDGFFSVCFGDENLVFCIHESGCFEGHHFTVATLPEMPGKPDN
jgi:4'-phosphopantetheinyl transferase